MSTVVRRTTLITVVLSGDVTDCAAKTLAGHFECYGDATTGTPRNHSVLTCRDGLLSFCPENVEGANMIFKQLIKLAVIGVASVINIAANAQQGKWADSSDQIAKPLVEMERQWAEAACTHSLIVQTILADDFRVRLLMESAIPSRKRSKERKLRRLRHASAA